MTKLNSNLSFFVGRVISIKHAVDGVMEILKTQRNSWVHLSSSLVVICLGLHFQLSNFEWCFLIVAITSVWVAEGLNTAFEYLCDVVSPEFHPLVKKSKDIAAGAVLFSAIGAVVVGILIFSPYI